MYACIELMTADQDSYSQLNSSSTLHALLTYTYVLHSCSMRDLCQKASCAQESAQSNAAVA